MRKKYTRPAISAIDIGSAAPLAFSEQTNRADSKAHITHFDYEDDDLDTSWADAMEEDHQNEAYDMWAAYCRIK